jgi:alanine dehydrogenase
LFINNDDVKQVLTMDECIRTQEEAFRGLLTRESVHRSRIDVYVPTEQEPEGYYRWGTMEGASKSLGVHAIRMKSDVITWPRDPRGNWTEDKYCVQPGTYCGLIFLLSTRTGEPLALINDGLLQHMRVAAGAGIGVKYLAREDAHLVGMLGSGGMARTYLEAFCTVRPTIERVKVYSPTKKNREAYAQEMGEKLGIEVIPVESARDAVEGVDIVSSCTDSMEPTFKGEWLEPGMHVTNLGSHELDEAVFRRATFVLKQGVSGVSVSDPEQRVELSRGHSPIAFIAGTDEEVRRLPEPVRTRQFETPGLGAELPRFTDLASGRVQGRRGHDDITVYLAVGYQGLQFAAAGAVVYRRAKERGLGREVPTDWFLQDIRD